MSGIVLSLASVIQSNKHFDELKEIIQLCVEAESISQRDVDRASERIQENQEWQTKNYDNIEIWLNGGTPVDPTEPPPPTPTTPPSTPNSGSSEMPTSTESTTLGSSSVIVSFTAIVFCTFVKIFL